MVQPFNMGGQGFFGFGGQSGSGLPNGLSSSFIPEDVTANPASGGGSGFDISKLMALLGPLAQLGGGQQGQQGSGPSSLPPNASVAPGQDKPISVSPMPIGGNPQAGQPTQISAVAAALQNMSKLDPVTIKNIFSRLGQGGGASPVLNPMTQGATGNFGTP